MKLTKIISIITSIVVSLSVYGMDSVNAEESYEKIYTLNELLEMNNEDFLKLDGAQAEYDKLRKYQEWADEAEDAGSGKLSGTFLCPTLNSEKYKANISENSVNKLLADSIPYETSEPISNEGVYNHNYLIEFDGLYGVEDTEDNILMHTKLLYCLKQILDFGYFPVGYTLSASTNEVIKGDVNLDESIDLYDAVWIASYLVHIFDLSEGQQKVADVNSDGACNLYDAVEIAKTLMP
jgi:hypothetical protein